MAANAGFALLATDLASAVPFRFLTGAGVAAVYPIGMKVLASWFRDRRGLAARVRRRVRGFERGLGGLGRRRDPGRLRRVAAMGV